MTDEEIIRRLTDIRRSIVQKNKDFIRDDEAMTWAIECVKHASKPWCKFRSEKNCDFCAFHSDCEIHWKEGEANDRPCEKCKHKVETKPGVEACDVWDCSFEPKDEQS